MKKYSNSQRKKALGNYTLGNYWKSWTKNSTLFRIFVHHARYQLRTSMFVNILTRELPPRALWQYLKMTRNMLNPNEKLFLDTNILQFSIFPSGCLIGRQRIKLPESDEFYDVIDFNIGGKVVLYGRTFYITNCDAFTRNFLKRLGIRVADPVDVPPDPYMLSRSEVWVH